MKTIIVAMFRGLFGWLGKGFKCISGWCFSALQKVGVGTGYLVSFLLVGAGAAGVLTTTMPLNLASLGLTLFAARIFGIFCLLLAGFSLAHVVNADAKIRAEKIEKDKAEFTKELKTAKDQLESANKDLENKTGEIENLKKEIKEKDVQIFKAARTVNFASVKDVVKLFLIEAEMTIYDFDNDTDMDNREPEAEGFISIGHHRRRSLWQYIGFQEKKIKVNFGLNLNDLHLEFDSSSGEEVLYVYGVKPTHSFESLTKCRDFSMLRKIYLKECKLNRDDKDYLRRRADMEVIETRDGKTWEIDTESCEGGEYTLSKNKEAMKKGNRRQEERMENIINGMERTPYEALDKEVVKRAEEFLRVLLNPICRRVEVIIKGTDKDHTGWERIKNLPNLQKFCEDYNAKQLQCFSA